VAPALPCGVTPTLSDGGAPHSHAGSVALFLPGGVAPTLLGGGVAPTLPGGRGLAT